MSSVAVTPALVLPSVLTFRRAQAGTPITAGQWIYLNASDSYRAYLATASAAAAASAGAVGMAINTAHTVGAPVEWVGEDTAAAVGGIVTAGEQYYLSPTAGEACQVGDLASGHYVVPLYVGKAGNLAAIKINSTAQTK